MPNGMPSVGERRHLTLCTDDTHIGDGRSVDLSCMM